MQLNPSPCQVSPFVIILMMVITMEIWISANVGPIYSAHDIVNDDDDDDDDAGN